MSEAVTGEALRARMEKGERLSILDVRPKTAFDSWRIPGAFHCEAEPDLLAGRPGRVSTFELLPRDLPVVVAANEEKAALVAAQVLRERGFQASPLAGGMRAWTGAWNTAEVSTPGAEGTRVIQVRRAGRGCLSYIVASDREAAVIDPSVDPAVYLQIAGRNGWHIKHVIETHVHADHLSTARALCHDAIAGLYVPRSDRTHFSARAVEEGTTIDVGSSRLTAIRTPGHTAESTCYHLDGTSLFTGDTLYLSSVGTPDLDGDRTALTVRGIAQHASLQRIATLPANTLVLPGHAHAPVPFDRRPWVSQLGQVRTRAQAMGLTRDEFVARLLERARPAPQEHKLIVRANEAGAAGGLDAATLEAGPNGCAAL